MKRLVLLCLFSLVMPVIGEAALTWETTTYVVHDKAKTQVPGQSARLIVPEDSARPQGAKVELRILRLPAATKTPGAPVVYLHGGPGGSSVEHLESPEFRALFAALQAHGDVILFDQRGCGNSTPSLVPPPGRVAPEALATRENFLAHLEKTSIAVRDRLVQAGHDPHLYTVEASVADIEALRTALGTDRINLLAHSYGTQLAQAFVRVHPAAVEKLVLIGSRGMDTARKLPAQADDFLAVIARLARSDPTVGATFPDLVGTLRRVLAKLDQLPLAVVMENEKKQSITVNVGGFALRFIVAKFYLKDPDNFKYLPKLLDEIDQGRRPWSLIFNLGQILRSPISYAWFTTDAASGVTAARSALIQAQSATAILGDAANFPFPEINAIWAMPDAGEAFRAPVQSDVPTLFVAGTLDGITPVEQTREIKAHFSHSQLLVVENGGHDSQLRPAEVAAAIAGFFSGKPAPETARLPAVEFMPLITAGAK